VECASSTQVRVCNGTTAGVQNCPNGCTNGRGCNQCTGNGVQCVNGNTIRRCVNGFFQDQTCQFGCNAGSQQCNACQGSGTTCSNGNTQQQCVNGQFANTNCPLGCVAGRCANCNTGQCNNNQFRACNNGQLANAVTCQDPANPCIGPSCNPQTGCGQANLTGNSCSDGNACNGNETCQNGACNNPPDVQCPAPPACRTVACNPQNGQCTQSNVPDGTGCGGGSTCQNGACIAPDPCATTNCNAVLPAASRPCSTGTRCVSGNGIAV